MTSQMMNWLSQWRPVSQVDDDEMQMNLGSRLMPEMVEMRGFHTNESSGNYALLHQGAEGRVSWYPAKWRRGILAVSLLFFASGALLLLSAGRDDGGEAPEEGNSGTYTSSGSYTGTASYTSSGGGGSSSGSGSSSSSSTTSYSSDPTEHKSWLTDSTVEYIQKNPASPQAKALGWVENHPNYDDGAMPEWRKQQLLAISTMLFSDCGDMPPSSHNTNECTWHQTLTNDSFGFDIECNVDARIQTWKKPKCSNLLFRGHSGYQDHQTSWRLPPQISLLTSLTNLYLTNSHITGSIPTELGVLTGLTYLGLGMNQMTLAVPSQLGALTALTSLLLNENSLSGSLPTELGQLTVLEGFTANQNQLTGPLPSQIQYMTSLRTLDLHQNQLSGSLPDLGTLSELRQVRLDENRLSGPLSSNLGALTELTSLIIPHNQFTGSIPTQVGLLTALQVGILLGDNQLTGTIPTQLGQLTKLQELGLATNQLVGTLPSELGLITNLQQFSVHDNQKVKGKLPSSAIAQWDNIWIMWIFNTSLTGTVPDKVCDSSRSPSLKVDCTKVDCYCDQCECFEVKEDP